MSEHSKYCTRINEYWLNKNDFAYIGGEIVVAFTNDCYFSKKSPNDFCSVRAHFPVQIDKFIEGDEYLEAYFKNIKFFKESLDSIKIGIYQTDFKLGDIERFSN